MKRKAILIGSPDVKPELPGVDVDLNDICQFLLSPRGGQWKREEITILRNPSKLDVTKELVDTIGCDYTFVTCSGHGEHQVGEGLDNTVMYLREHETMKISDIKAYSNRSTIIVDTCRNLVKVTKKELLKALNESLGFAMESASNINFREAFNTEVMNCSEGRIVLYSCDINQSAGDDGSGGVFTQNLLNSSNAITNTNLYSYTPLYLDAAFEFAKEKTTAENYPQRPVMNAGRRRDFYPFAIIS